MDLTTINIRDINKQLGIEVTVKRLRAIGLTPSTPARYIDEESKWLAGEISTIATALAADIIKRGDMKDKVQEAHETLKQAMIEDGGEPGSYADSFIIDLYERMSDPKSHEDPEAMFDELERIYKMLSEYLTK